jgi:hypothetical protein
VRTTIIVHSRDVGKRRFTARDDNGIKVRTRRSHGMLDRSRVLSLLFFVTLPAGIHITRLTKDPVLTNPDDAVPAGNYSVVLTAIDSHGSRAVTTSSLSVAACPAPAGNRAPVASLTGALPYTLAVCNGRGSVTLDASTSYDPDAADKIARYVWEVRAARLGGEGVFSVLAGEC